MGLLPSLSQLLLVWIILASHLTSFVLAQLLPYLPQTITCPNSKTNPLVIKGKRFYDSVTGEYVPIKGITYFPRPNTGELSGSASVDYYGDSYRERWEKDVEWFKLLNINAIRIYAVDPSQNHEPFLCALQEAGIYVFLGLLADCLDCGIGSTAADDSPPDCYSQGLKERGQYIIQKYSQYANVAAFSAGNEATIFTEDDKSNAPCQKKFIRDMRHFVYSCAADSDMAVNPILTRSVPIGVVGWDRDEITAAQTEYFACQSNPNEPFEPMEWYGINTYRHCDSQALTVDDLGGFLRLRNLFAEQNLDLPIVLGEYGCRAQGFPRATLPGDDGGPEFGAQRTWLQIDMLYATPDYMDVFAGGFAYEFSAEKIVVDRSLEGQPWPYYEYMQLNYGMGYLAPLECDNIDVMCQFEPYPEFFWFGEKMAAADTSFIPSINEDSGQVPGVIPECPSEYPPLSDIFWPTDEDDEVISLCTTSNTQAATTLPPTTMSPTAKETLQTPSPTEEATDVVTVVTSAAEATEAPTSVDITFQPTDSLKDPVPASTTVPSTQPLPTTPSIPPTQPSVSAVPPTQPTTPSGPLQVHEECVLNPTCAAQNGLVAVGVNSCCPTRDDRSLFLDCCAASTDFCYDASGTIAVCRSMSTSQYLSEVLNGQRDPSSIEYSEISASESSSRPGKSFVFSMFALLVCVVASFDQ